MSFNMVLLWKLEFFWKMIKRDELSEILELIGSGLWYAYVEVAIIVARKGGFELWPLLKCIPETLNQVYILKNVLG